MITAGNRCLLVIFDIKRRACIVCCGQMFVSCLCRELTTAHTLKRCTGVLSVVDGCPDVIRVVDTCPDSLCCQQIPTDTSGASMSMFVESKDLFR